MTQGINNPLPPPSSPFKATLILRYFLRYFSSTSTEQISPDSAGPFIVSILLALLFSLIQRRRSRMVVQLRVLETPHLQDRTPLCATGLAAVHAAAIYRASGLVVCWAC